MSLTGSPGVKAQLRQGVTRDFLEPLMHMIQKPGGIVGTRGEEARATQLAHTECGSPSWPTRSLTLILQLPIPVGLSY